MCAQLLFVDACEMKIERLSQGLCSREMTRSCFSGYADLPLPYLCAMLQSFKALICRHNAVLLMFYSSASLKSFIDRFDLILFK